MCSEVIDHFMCTPGQRIEIGNFRHSDIFREPTTGEFSRLGRYFLDCTTAVAGEGDA